MISLMIQLQNSGYHKGKNSQKRFLQIDFIRKIDLKMLVEENEEWVDTKILVKQAQQSVRYARCKSSNHFTDPIPFQLLRQYDQSTYEDADYMWLAMEWLSIHENRYPTVREVLEGLMLDVCQKFSSELSVESGNSEKQK